MRPLLAFHLLVTSTVVLGFKFINPPAFEETTDFSLNPIYPMGSLLSIKWNEASENNTSLTLWQLNGTKFLFPLEYLTHNISGSVTSLDWNVQTTKDLSVSNMFYLSLFVEGSTSTLGNSHYFNITDTKDKTSSTQTSTPTITTGPTSLIPTTTEVPSTSTSTSTSTTTTTPPEPVSAGLSSGTKAGIGVGVSAAGLMAIGAAVFAIRERRARKKAAAPPEFYAGFYSPAKQEPIPRIVSPQVHELGARGVDRGPTELPT